MPQQVSLLDQVSEIVEWDLGVDRDHLRKYRGILDEIQLIKEAKSSVKSSLREAKSPSYADTKLPTQHSLFFSFAASP